MLRMRPQGSGRSGTGENTRKEKNTGVVVVVLVLFFLLFFSVKTEGRSFMRRGRRAMRPHVSGSSGRIEKK